MSHHYCHAQRRTRIGKRHPPPDQAEVKHWAGISLHIVPNRTFPCASGGTATRARCHTTTGAEHDSVTLAPRPDAPAVAMEER